MTAPAPGSARDRILVVEDDRVIRECVRAYLVRFGYDVDVAWDGEMASAMLGFHTYNLAVVDLVLPKLPGERVCELAKQKPGTAVVVVSGKSAVDQVVAGLDHGMDDYMTKPFSPRELVARVGAILRREHANADGRVVGSCIVSGDLVIDTEARRVTVGEREVQLTRSEFEILRYLAAHPGVDLSKERIIDEALGGLGESCLSSFSSHIKKIRKKLGDSTVRPKWIHTVVGGGYRFEDPPEG